MTGYNSEYSDRPFAYKRDQVTNQEGKKIGFKYSPLNLNEGLGNVEKWDEEAIKTRASSLAVEAAKVWTAPQLATDVLDAYRPAAAKTGQQYAITDHPHLAYGPMHELFAALRKAVLALDPCVSEEFLKLYVAYKAETNFVDVVPQAKRLLLVLNLCIDDIEDPKDLCRDISDIGRWGNGDVEVGLASLDDLPYVMGLVRQSFDRQMGGPQDA
jgi:predicted transport protein